MNESFDLMFNDKMTNECVVDKESLEKLCELKFYVFLSRLRLYTSLKYRTSRQNSSFLDRMLECSKKLIVIESDDRHDYLPYTHQLIHGVKEEMLRHMNNTFYEINHNLQKLRDSFVGLCESYELFILSTQDIDWENNSNLIKGTPSRKPLSYNVDNSFDIMHCLKIHEKTLQVSISNVNIRDESSILELQKSFSLSRNFEDLILSYFVNSWSYWCELKRLPQYQNVL